MPATWPFRRPTAATTIPGRKNRDLVIAALPTVTERVEQVLAAAPDGPLLVLGGECTIHPAVMAGIIRARALTLALAWFDAHGDFHTTETTPGGSIWGMPLALSCGRGDAGLVAAAGGGVVTEEDTALLGGQSVEANEAFMLASSRLAHFGSGMLATEAGMAALGAWAAAVAARVDGFYIAFDMDCLDASGNWAVTLAEPGGLALDTAVAAIRVLTDHGPIQGMGFTTVSLGSGDGPKTAAAVAELGVAALG